MSRVLADLVDGEAFEETVLVREKQVRTNRNGNQYLQLELYDRSGSLGARYWNVTETEARSFDTGDFLKIKAKAQIFQGQMQLIVSAFQRCDPATLNLADFTPSTSHDIAELVSDLRAQLGRIQDPYLQALAQAYLMDQPFMDQLARAPAGIRNHHAYLGGLLEHIVQLLRLVEAICPLYPALNADMMRLGVLLHDSGKVRELSYDVGFSYSDEGQLIGHLVIGVEMLNEKLPLAADLLGEPIPDDLVLEIKHLILSHHGAYEFGSPKLPMTAEAMALHYLDNIDAKIHHFEQMARLEPAGDSSWTAYDQSLGRRLYKGKQRG